MNIYLLKNFCLTLVTRKKSRWDQNTTNLLTSVDWIVKVTFYYIFEEMHADRCVAESENVEPSSSASRFRLVNFPLNFMNKAWIHFPSSYGLNSIAN